MTADPSPIVRVATGFMAAKQLFAASECGVFAALADGPLSLADLAERTELPRRSAHILADAMVGLSLLTFADGRYRNSEAAAEYLTGTGLDLRPFLAFWDTLSYPHWQSYDISIRDAKPTPFDFSEARMEVFLDGVQTYNSLHARMLAEHYDFTAHEHVADFGGLSPAFLIEAAARNPRLRGDFVTSGQLLDYARDAISADLADRISLHDVDPLSGPLPGSYDAILLEHVIHRFDAEQNQAILRVARQAAQDGARLLVLDFLLDSGDARVLDPLLAGEYLVIDGTVVYPENEVRGWLEDTGWRWLETRALPGSPRVMIAEAI
nr:acetylserotonin O-methyltransferase [Kibdelosporangium sp. MJ126-NF4]CEL14288.1 polyketide synthesis 8-O-methyltransferase [Kibdelosporangium sp. MJ126-NF4]CTQ88655.1 polyketide synthesis 8-O-methyltransferase(EC:2.1.1.-) [Kibdelosporangium sp. MJ126-NF4]